MPEETPKVNHSGWGITIPHHLRINVEKSGDYRYMKILLVSDYGTRDGGAEIVTLSLRDGLRMRGHDALLFATSAGDQEMTNEADIVCYGTTGPHRTLLQTANISARRELKRVLAHFQPDVVHVGLFLTQLSPLILPLLRNVPTVFYAHWLRAICPTGFKLLPNETACHTPAGVVCLRSGCLPFRDWVPVMAQMQMWRRSRGVFDRIVANSNATRAMLSAEGFENVTVIPCGVAAEPPSAGFIDTPTVLFCGRLTRQKGVHVLLDAWRTVVSQCPNARLLIAGDGPERDVLERSAPSGVTFLGSVPHAELNRSARGVWIQVVPSLGFEPFALVAAEGMMRESAVVATATGGVVEVVEHGVTGLLAKPGDHEGLAAAMLTLLNDRATCEEMGRRGRRRAEEQYGEDLYVERFVTLYESLLAEKRKD